jgi:hypothetical protein
MDTQTTHARGGPLPKLARLAAAVCFATTCGLMIGSLVAQTRARSGLEAGAIDRIGYAAKPSPRA